MVWSKNIATGVLAVFVLSTSVCPCAQAVADLAANPDAMSSPHNHAGYDEGSHAAGVSHAHHGASVDPADAAAAETSPCHADVAPGADCGMADAAELAANPLKPEQSDDLPWALPAFTTADLAACPRLTLRVHSVREKDRKPGLTPVESGDRLLI